MRLKCCSPDLSYAGSGRSRTDCTSSGERGMGNGERVDACLSTASRVLSARLASPCACRTLGHGRKRLELAGGVVGDETGERGLPRAGGPPEDARPHVAAADQLPQGFAGPEQVLLAEKVLKRCGAHAGGEGLATPPLA